MNDVYVPLAPGTAMPVIPEPLPRRLGPPGPSVRTRHLQSNFALGGARSYLARDAAPSRLVRRGNRVFLLHANTLHSFELDEHAGTLGHRSRLSLGPAHYPPTVSHVPAPPASHAAGAHTITYADGALSGLMIADYLFVQSTGLIVLGSRQDTQAIEVARIAVDAQGALRRTRSDLIHLMRAEWDGYRADLVDGALVIYFRHGLQGEAYTLPSIGQARGSEPPRTLLHGRDVHHPLFHAEETYLHTLLRCDVSAQVLDCRARAIPAPSATDFTMTRDAAYVWLVASRGEPQPPAGVFVYRMPFDGTEPTAVRTREPFSLLARTMQVRDGHLHALLPDGPRGGVVLLRLPLAHFSGRATQLSGSVYRHVEGLLAEQLEHAKVELVAQHWLLHEDDPRVAGDLRPGSITPSLHAVPLASARAHPIALGHAAHFVSARGAHAAVVGTDSWNLHTSLIAAGQGAAGVVAKHVFRDAVRHLAGYGPAHVLDAVDDGRWLLLQTSALAQTRPAADMLLPLHWRAGGAHVEAPADAAEWSVAFAPQRDAQPFGIDVLTLASDLTVLRMQDELLVHRFTPNPRLSQRIPLHP